jgi:UDP-2,3-diacylglucosamine hydrolase
MSLFVISDLHIGGADDTLYSSLLSLIQDKASSGDTLVLAGDIFDLFVGNKAVFVQRYFEFFKALETAGQRGVRLHYIEGNHDFLIRPVFQRIPGMTVHTKDFALEIGQRRFYFAHGDTVDRGDISYLALRLFFRSPIMKGIVSLIPGEWLDAFGQWSSAKSRNKKPRLAAELPLERIDHLRKVYRNFAAERLSQGNDFVVMGHCHDLDEMFFNIGGRQAQYINVGFPRVHGSFLSWSPGDEKIQREKLPIR